jgi:acetylornithine deacetylase/succinyl-diaminopimelate desuccinylase-like protein
LVEESQKAPKSKDKTVHISLGEAMRSEWEEKVLAEIELDELIDLLQKLQAFHSWSGEEQEAAEFMANWMDENGFEAELQEVEPNRSNALGYLRGSGEGPSLMFNGHLDIDPIPMDYKYDPWNCRIEDGVMYGHGIANMKAGVTAMTIAATALKRAGVPLKGDIMVAGVVGELQAGVGTHYMVQSGIVPDLAVVPEPSELKVRTVHAGVLEILIHTRGKSGWVGGTWMYKTVSAVEKMYKVIDGLNNLKFSFKRREDLPHLPRLVVGAIMGGITEEYAVHRPAFVPDFCTIAVDIRIPPGMTFDEAVADIEQMLSDLEAEDPDLHTEIELPPAAYRQPWFAMQVAMPPLDTPHSEPIVQTVAARHKFVTGEDPHIGIEMPGSHAGTDAGHLSAAGTKALIYGPTSNAFFESQVVLDHLLTCSRVHALTALDMCADI